MKTRNSLVLMLALACAFCMAILVACGGGGASSAASSEAASSTASAEVSSSAVSVEAGSSEAASAQETSSEAALSDEEVIKDNLEKTIGAFLTKDVFVAALRANDSTAGLEEMGMSLDELADVMLQVIKFEIVSVEVNGDTAVAKCKMTMPDFNNEEAENVLADVLIRELDGADPTTVPEDEQAKILMKVMKAALTDPAFPMISQDLDIDYEKKGDTWLMVGQDSLESSLGDALGGF